jgi:hypothetical protein
VSNFRAHSFDQPRERDAVTELRGTTQSGDERLIHLQGLTLIAAVKPHCDGCRDFIFGDLHELAALDVIVVSASASDDGEWEGALQPVLVAPEALAALDVRSAPHYVLVDPSAKRVVTEGVLFSPVQVASEIAPFLSR